jgi:hypothetical protein
VSLLRHPGLRIEIITAVNLKITVRWNVVPCGLGLEPVPAEYQPFDRVSSSSIRVKFVNFRAIKGYEGGIAVFIFNILVGLSGQLRAPSA